MSNFLIKYAELLSNRVGIMQYPNRAEMVVIFFIVSFISDIIRFLIGVPVDIYLYYPIVIIVIFEEFVQFSIIAHIKDEKLFQYCLKYAFIFWFVETINNYLGLIYRKSYIENHIFLSTISYFYGRIFTFLIYFSASISRFYSLTRFKHKAALFFMLQVFIHTAWNINQPLIIDAIFAPIIKLEQIFGGFE